MQLVNTARKHPSTDTYVDAYCRCIRYIRPVCSLRPIVGSTGIHVEYTECCGGASTHY